MSQQFDEAECSSYSKYVDECLERGPSAMGFLLTKVDRGVLDPVERFPCFLIDCCLAYCLRESETNGSFSENAILHSTLIKRILTILQDFSFSLTIESQRDVISYIFRSWNSSIEVVCHEAVDIFFMLLSNHCLVCSTCKARKGCEWSNSLAKKLFENNSPCRSRYKCLLILFQSYSTYIELIDEKLVEELYSFIGDPGLSVVISELLLMDIVEFPGRWIIHNQLILSCLSNESIATSTAIKDRLLPKLAKSKVLKNEFLPQLLDFMNENCMKVHCIEAILSVCRFLILSHKKCDSYKYWSDYVPLRTMQYAVLHLDVQVRLSAWILLSEHPQRTHGFSSSDILLIRVFLISNMTEQSPAIRLKILAGLRKILSRIAESSEQILKGNEEDLGQVAMYNSFISFLLSLAFDSLSPGANFSRRIMALSIVQCLFVEESLVPHQKTLFFDQLNLSTMLTSKWYEALISCIDDPFELCQITALDILKKIPVDDNFNLSLYKEETIKMMKSISSHSTLASGYRIQFYTWCRPESLTDLLVDFVSLCEDNTHAAKNNLVCFKDNSIHPWMNAISLLLENKDFSDMSTEDLKWWTFFIRERLIPLCFNVAEVVSPAVHSMSPEGYIPEETLNEIANFNGNILQMETEVSQLLLVCCWRAHKHVSTILGFVATKLYPMGMLSSEEIDHIGAYYWLQLTECKHCGAFETA
ncbi:hypothetical protein KIN20_024539 [Parelaphostrongylus tenuis]|uniref:tRNA (32-2'-O)-methyltransferase regulator THADA n=1 Tax=Parelaphostrongylus tenuis TaxID=148309 RepID=A0AAD5NCW2_PARTN|nr:hypothetical protein KIN20_024539 [Parelaphostrongylus tenuis]